MHLASIPKLSYFGNEIEILYRLPLHRSESQNLGHQDSLDAGYLEIWLRLEFCLCTHFVRDKRKI